MEVSSEKKSRKSAAFARQCLRKEIAKGEEARKVSKHGKKRPRRIFWKQDGLIVSVLLVGS